MSKSIKHGTDSWYGQVIEVIEEDDGTYTYVGPHKHIVKGLRKDEALKMFDKDYQLQPYNSVAENASGVQIRGEVTVYAIDDKWDMKFRHEQELRPKAKISLGGHILRYEGVISDKKLKFVKFMPYGSSTPVAIWENGGWKMKSPKFQGWNEALVTIKSQFNVALNCTNLVVANAVAWKAENKVARNWNYKNSYKFFCVDPSMKAPCILSGWDYQEDAKDDAAELKELNIPFKIVSRTTLERAGIDPNADSSWKKNR